MSRPREVIDSYMEEVLFKLVSQSIRNMPAEDAADAAKKLRAFEDFNRDCILSSNNPWFCQSKFLGTATEIPW